jgi:hypothetical protein
MTTIIAIRCKNAVIMAADKQATGFTKETVTKITPLDQNRLVACAGAATYIGLFKDILRDTLKRHRGRHTDNFKIINEAGSSYRESTIRIAESTDTHTSNPKFYPEAIFAAFEKKQKSNRLFQTAPDLRDPFLEVLSPQNRATAGHGGDSATVFLRSAEDVMARMDSKLIDINWMEFSPRLVSQLCFVLLRRISYIDPYTSGQQIYQLDSLGGRELDPQKDIFDNAQKSDLTYVTVLVRTIRKEVDREKILKLVEVFRVPELIKEYLR